jgi:hypothetical protein
MTTGRLEASSDGVPAMDAIAAAILCLDRDEDSGYVLPGANGDRGIKSNAVATACASSTRREHECL